MASPKQQSNEVSISIAHICVNFHVVFFAENFQECAILNAVHEEIFKLHIFIESRSEYFLKREDDRPVARIFYGWVRSVDYTDQRAPFTRGVRGHAPPGNFEN